MGFDAAIRISGCLAGSVTSRSIQPEQFDTLGFMDDDDTPTMDGRLRPTWRARFRRSQSLNYLRTLSAARRTATHVLSSLAQLGALVRSPVRPLASARVKVAVAQIDPRMNDAAARSAPPLVVSGKTDWSPARYRQRAARPRQLGAANVEHGRRDKDGGFFSRLLGFIDGDTWLALLRDAALMLGYGAAPTARLSALATRSRLLRNATVEAIKAPLETSDHDDAERGQEQDRGHDEPQDETPAPVYMEDESVVHAKRSRYAKRAK